jgi:uncharacterized YkwD family protein
MKRKIIFLIVLTLIFTSVMSFTATNTTTLNAASYFQKADFINGIVTVAQLNVRTGPDQKFPITCVLKKGQKVKVFGMLGEWYAIYDATSGCVGSAFSKYIKVDAFANVPAKKTTKTPVPAPKVTPKPVPSATQAPGAEGKDTTPPAGISQEEQELLNLVNKARADAGAGPLSFDMGVVKTARLKAKDMVDNNYFSHQSPTYGSPFDMMKQFNVTFKTAGENIAGNATVSGAFTAWMNSPGHKKNILNSSFNYNGIGIVDSPTYGKVLVQQFIGK